MSDILSFLQLALTSTLRMSVPIVLGAVGACYSMRSGVTAFGCEGMMITGALCGVVGTMASGGNNIVGVLFAVLGGMLISLLHAYLHVTHKVNATLSGICINLLGLGLTALVLEVVWNSKSYSPSINNFKVFNPEWLTKIPILGSILAQQYVFFYIAIIIVVTAHLVMYKTNFGLRLRMVGDNPVAANTVGINTVKYKYIGVLVSGALSGLGGSYLSLAMLSFFQKDMTAGRGFIAMVACNLSNSYPLGAALAGLFFGFFNSMQTLFQGVNFPSQILMTMPYVFTLVASVLNISKRKGPAGVGKHFDDE